MLVSKMYEQMARHFTCWSLVCLFGSNLNIPAKQSQKNSGHKDTNCLLNCCTKSQTPVYFKTWISLPASLPYDAKEVKMKLHSPYPTTATEKMGCYKQHKFP
jgi:hypothetical protein